MEARPGLRALRDLSPDCAERAFKSMSPASKWVICPMSVCSRPPASSRNGKKRNKILIVSLENLTLTKTSLEDPEAHRHTNSLPSLLSSKELSLPSQ